MNSPDQKIGAIAYARVSTLKQSKHGESLEDQEKSFHKIVEERNFTLLPFGKVSTETYSGSSQDRPVYQSLLQYIKDNPGKVKYFLIRYIDRFSRGGATEYQNMKDALARLGVDLIDTYGIIQPARNHPDLEKLGFEYSWSKESPSEFQELMLATTAKQERVRILTRTIAKEIEYTQMGYKIRAANDGFVNTQIEVDRRLRYTQTPDPKRAPFFIKMYEMKASGEFTDQEIVNYVNDAMGYRSKRFKRWNENHTEIIGYGGGNTLTKKRLNHIIQKLAYVGIICEKWTHYKPVKAQWDGLVSIDVFNRANRGKIFVEDFGNGAYQILYNHQPVKKKHIRLRNNPDYPFKCLCCPVCGASLKGSASTGKSGKRFPAYHCERGHKSFRIPKEKLHDTVETFLESIQYSQDVLEAFEEVLLHKFRERQKNITQEASKANEHVADLKSRQAASIDQLIQTKNEIIRGVLEKRIEELEVQINRATSYRFSTELQEDHIKKFITYTKKIVEHPKKTLLDKENPLRQRQLLDLLFEGMPTYDELVSNTKIILYFQ